MNDRVDPFEIAMRATQQNVDELTALKGKDAAAYRKAVADLQLAAQGKEVKGRYADFSMDLADAVLMELGEEQVETSRDEIEEILARDIDQFMGDPEHFMTIEDALENGELDERVL